MALVHHELCFGCGQVNLFGLLLEVQSSGPGAVVGRCFVKQDHQGPERSTAHDGIVASALTEAMALACGPQVSAERLEVEFLARAPVGEFIQIEARREDYRLQAAATASFEGEVVARASGSYR